MNIDISKYMIPALGTLCAAGMLMVVSGMRTPFEVDTDSEAGGSVARLPESLVLDGYVPTMEEVVAKHLFVPERVATGENAFPDLVVKGIYVGTERNAVFSLKSKPQANLRVWQGDEDAALGLAEDDRDPRKAIAEFLNEWQIKEIDFSGVTVEHLITGEVETYAVDYKPAKHIKDSAQSGYGQGGQGVASASAAKAPTARTAAQARAGQQNAPAFSPQTAAGRVGAFMQRMTPQQRQQFMQQLQKQNAASAKKNGSSDANQKKNTNKSSKSKGGGGGKRQR